MKKNIEDTIEFIRIAFEGILDKGGLPYNTHCERVYQNLIKRWPNVSEDVQHAALLHDIVEDTDNILSDLLDLGYSQETVDIVDWLSNNSPRFKEMTYQEHIKMICEYAPLGVIQIKICDNQDNNDDHRLRYLDEATQTRLKKKYNRARQTLETAFNNINSKNIDVVAA